jgi:osmotically-inducible protein OsmY
MRTVSEPSANTETERGDSGPVLEDLRRRLKETGYHELRQLDVTYHEGLVVLRGRVGSYYVKQLAQSVLMRVEGICLLVNSIEVSVDLRSDDPIGDIYGSPGPGPIDDTLGRCGKTCPEL